MANGWATNKKTRQKFKIREKAAGIKKSLSREEVSKMGKKVHIHGLELAGYAVDAADSLRKRAIRQAVKKYGKSDVMMELTMLRTKYENNARMENVIDSDISYVANGKFEEA